MYIIAGLGNPGKKYEHTRHNVGFDVMDVLAEKYNIRMDEKKYKAICGKGMIGSEKVVLVKPQTFMNLSGESIAEAVNFYKVDPASELLVILMISAWHREEYGFVKRQCRRTQWN